MPSVEKSQQITAVGKKFGSVLIATEFFYNVAE
jgi:hypothetical protein